MTASKESSAIDFRVTQGAIDGIVAAIAAAEPLCFSDPWSETVVRAALDSPAATALTAWQGETLVGFLLLTAVMDEGEIADIAVLPGYRRQGIGRELLTRGLALLGDAGVSEVYLDVRASNEPAQALYAALGFRPLGVRKHYYDSPREDAVLYRLSVGRKA